MARSVKSDKNECYKAIHIHLGEWVQMTGTADLDGSNRQELARLADPCSTVRARRWAVGQPEADTDGAG